MPLFDELVRGHEIGKRNKHLYIYAACFICGKERWVRLNNGKPRSERCHQCKNLGSSHSKEHTAKLSGENHYNWKGKIHKNKQGYISVFLHPSDFFYPMANSNGRIYEHRLVMARALGRCLLPWEIVHHKGAKYPSGSIENNGDNRYPENLQLLSDQRYHLIDSIFKRRFKQLENRVLLLEADNIALRKQLAEGERDAIIR